MSKARVATVWLDGCSGCHMSILDMDKRLIELSARLDLVYSPIVDTKEYPENVDIVLVEGAVSTPRRFGENSQDPPAHEDFGFARRLRGNCQRAKYA
jgi:coenzyme F420-reducing hydrogenase gamma subunit